MLRNQKLLLFLLPVCFAGFVFGIAQLFKLRFEQGDVYPPYSSLRSDPLGTKVFCESLGTMKSFSVSRLYEPLHKIKSGRDKTLFIIGAGPWELDWIHEQEVKDIERFLFEGGRMIISFQPLNSKTWSMRWREKREEEDKKEQEKTGKKKPRKKKNDLKDEDEDAVIVSLAEKWGLKCEFKDLDLDEEGNGVPEIAEQKEIAELPEEISWHTALYFSELNEAWKTIYSRDTNAVVITRAFGKGSVVLSSDSYFFSNEAMRQEREPELLAWFAGNNREILFDETHLGVQADPGIAALIRKYRLHGLIGGLVLLAGLFVWKNSFSFVPPHEDVFERNAMVVGKDSAAGFVNLLRRGISPAEILSTCLAEWKRTSSHRRDLAPKLQKIESLVQEENLRSPRERRPVESYRAISKILTERK